ncbi:hypothetical protein QO005_003234 [Rhizobium paknamense]|uniref:Uncharacterized protein n=1 Tax=Rhizobium paknamense TaxID=1206817 RepID=A0ABU0IF83_9HYPH|nr:hypothetical protein [Rhizobium paknamense]
MLQSENHAEDTLKPLTSRGRYGKLFGYDAYKDMFTLDQEHGI